jgi:hypothetical protein
MAHRSRSHARPAKRVAGCFVSSLLYAGSLTALLLACLAVVDLGGYCATGGPYVTRQVCGPEVAYVPPVAILAAVVATGFALGWARGFGPALAALVVPVLFTALGVVFVVGGLTGPRSFLPSAIICAPFFLLVGLGLLKLLAGQGLRWMVVGTRGTDGAALDHTPWNEDRRGHVRPATARDWLVALGTSLPGLGLGTAAAVLVVGS